MYIKEFDNHYFDCFTKSFIDKNISLSSLHQLEYNDMIYVLNSISVGHLKLIITVTTKCDLSCDYCFENCIESTHMSLETSLKLINSLENYINQHQIHILNYITFGGEPTLNKEVTQKICIAINNLSIKYNIKLSGTITTNGYQIDEDFLILLSNNGVNSVQIIFDGDEQANNKSRKLSDNNNLYQSTLKNIPVLQRIFKTLLIKYNISNYSTATYNNFLNDLNMFVDKSSCIIILELIKSTKMYTINHSYTELVKTFIDFIEFTVNMHFNYKTKIFISPCMDMKYNSYMIDTTGSAYSCISAFENHDFLLGDFNQNFSSEILKNLAYIKDKISLCNQCYKCTYLPI